MSEPLKQLSQAGVSIWLDDLSRDRIQSGDLSRLIGSASVVGVTTNPTIFATALANGNAYQEQISELKGSSTDEAIVQLTTTDVRDACDLFATTYQETDGVDGRVSIEVSPELANDTAGTVTQAKQLHDLVDRPQALIKIPATQQGLPAITETIAAGISVNVTLIFGLDRYREVIDAYLSGLEKAVSAGRSIDGIQSVASFFVSRVDTEIDARLDKIGTDQATQLKGRSAVANARLAYQLFTESLQSKRWQTLVAQGANPQRPLWASTGVKNLDYDDTLYVVDLVAPHVVNTMPEKTLRAVADHGEITGDTITPNYADAKNVLQQVADIGIDLDDVTQTLEAEGVAKFQASWSELEATVQKELGAA